MGKPYREHSAAAESVFRGLAEHSIATASEIRGLAAQATAAESEFEADVNATGTARKVGKAEAKISGPPSLKTWRVMLMMMKLSVVYNATAISAEHSTAAESEPRGSARHAHEIQTLLL